MDKVVRLDVKPQTPIERRVTLLVPLELATGEFEEYLEDALCAMFSTRSAVKIVGRNYPRQDGGQLMMYDIDVTNPGSFEYPWERRGDDDALRRFQQMSNEPHARD